MRKRKLRTIKEKSKSSYVNGLANKRKNCQEQLNIQKMTKKEIGY